MKKNKQMSKFYRKEIDRVELREDKTVLKLSDCIELIENSEFKDELLTLYQFDAIKDGTLLVAGLRQVIKRVLDKDRQFEKKDITCHISQVTLYDSDDSTSISESLLKFSGVGSELGEDFIIAQTAYSAGREYFEGTYHMQKFAEYCLKNGYRDLISSNITYLNGRIKGDKLTKSFRLLKNTDGDYFLRAITSSYAYKNYNIRFSLFVTVMSLYKLSAELNSQFRISYCEFSESFIRLHIETERQETIAGVGKVKFLLEMTNDEIKREAFKFSALFSIEALDPEDGYSIRIKPRSIKTPLISVRHNILPSTVMKQLNGLANFIDEAESEMRKDIAALSKIKKPDQLRHRLMEKILKSREEELKDYKGEITKQLDRKITTVSELLSLMGKVDALIPEYFEAKEYLRYLYYDILREGGRS